jgi:hypothetical protein
MFDILLNLTPHPVVIYAPGAPDAVTDATIVPVRVIAREKEPARLVEVGFESMTPAGGDLPIPLFHVNYLPQRITGLPHPEPRTGYIVSMPVALARPDRVDLLVPFREVRNRSGTVIGCRALARPTTRSHVHA